MSKLSVLHSRRAFVCGIQRNEFSKHGFVSWSTQVQINTCFSTSMFILFYHQHVRAIFFVIPSLLILHLCATKRSMNLRVLEANELCFKLLD